MITLYHVHVCLSEGEWGALLSYWEFPGSKVRYKYLAARNDSVSADVIFL